MRAKNVQFVWNHTWTHLHTQTLAEIDHFVFNIRVWFIVCSTLKYTDYIVSRVMY